MITCSSFIRPEFVLLTETDHEPCVCVCGLQLQTTGLQIQRGQGGQTHRENVNKKIVSSQKSNPLASRSYMSHLTHVTQLVTQVKAQSYLFICYFFYMPIIVSMYIVILYITFGFISQHSELSRLLKRVPPHKKTSFHSGHLNLSHRCYL